MAEIRRKEYPQRNTMEQLWKIDATSQSWTQNFMIQQKNKCGSEENLVFAHNTSILLINKCVIPT